MPRIGRLVLFHIFCRTDCRDGEKALAPPVFDAVGNLYGTPNRRNMNTEWCPTSWSCVAYEVQSLGGGKRQYRVLDRFGAFSNDGQLPYNAGVAPDVKGNVYGTTPYGGIGGTVFEPRQQDGDRKQPFRTTLPTSRQNGGARRTAGPTFQNHAILYGTASAGGDPTVPAA